MKKEEFFDVVDGLLQRLKGSDVSRMSVQWDDVQIELERGGVIAPSRAAVIAAADAVSVSVSSEPEPAADTGADTRKVTSPIVGTFYAAADPDAKPFVTVGQKVSKGDVLCIIEAMKMMNEIEAEADGVVVRAPVKNGQLVEFGQVLFEMEDR